MRKIAALAGLILTLSFILGGVVAPTVSASCAQAKVILYADTSGGDSTSFCIPNEDGNLSNNIATGCGLPSWNDCISRVTFIEGTLNTAVCLWTDSGFGGNGLRFIDDRTNYLLGSTWNDKVSSIEWGTNCLTD